MNKKLKVFTALLVALLLCIVFAYMAFATSTITMYYPGSATMTYIDQNGVTYVPDTYGYIYIPLSGEPAAVKAGFSPVFSYGASSTSVTCTKGTMVTTPGATGSQHGSVYACYSTNKAIYTGRY